MRTLGHYLAVFCIAAPFLGCATGPFPIVDNSSTSGAAPGSPEWWSEKAMLPPGSRQVCVKGKMWPPQPRPTCERQQFSHTYHSAHYWPLPYVCQDRQVVRDIVNVQLNNGWQEQTTLYDRHFEPDQQLSVPGRLHLLDILEIVPAGRRTVFVQSSYNAEIDSTRLTNVQLAVAELTGPDSVPVVLRPGREYSRPASEVKVINDLYISSTPTPRLASAAGGGGAGGGGAAGAISGAAPTGP